MKYFYNQNSRFLSYFVKKRTKKNKGAKFLWQEVEASVQLWTAAVQDKDATRCLRCVLVHTDIRRYS